MFKNNFFTLVIVIVLLVAGGFYLYGNNFKNFLSTNGNLNATPTLSPNAKIEEFTIDGSNFSFTPNQIKATKGDVIKITFKNTGGLHNLSFPTMHVTTKTIPAGQQDTISFIADKIGTFPFYDAYAHHKEFGMTGTLIVEQGL